jgi:hypothetical protein
MRRRIFVFGSNLMGYHGGGAAKFAADHCGAAMGVGEGLTGESYALPTCKAPGVPLDKSRVIEAINTFRAFALARPEMDFLLTAVGCGIAGFDVEDIAELCEHMPDNVYLQARLAYGLL